LGKWPALLAASVFPPQPTARVTGHVCRICPAIRPGAGSCRARSMQCRHHGDV